MMAAIEEEEEEGFLITSLRIAAEEGDVEKLKELLKSTNENNLNCKLGDILLHTAVTSGHLPVVKYLNEDLKINLKQQESLLVFAAVHNIEVLKYLEAEGLNLALIHPQTGETALHVAARFDYEPGVKYLSDKISLDIQDKLGDTALHVAVWNGVSLDVIHCLCSGGAAINLQNTDGLTPLHVACVRGFVDIARLLLTYNASTIIQDQKGCTALHLACRRGHVPIALSLLRSPSVGDCMDLVDVSGECALHVAAKENLLGVVEALCALGCEVDIKNRSGHTPLHIACRSGYIEVVRCLLLSGSSPDLVNKEGVTAEVMAIAQGHSDVADLVSKIKIDRRDVYVRQLYPGRQPLDRVKLKILGDQGSGKSTVVESLKCGYIGSFFKKTKVTDASKGISVQQVDVSGVGPLSLWEFSGCRNYYQVYDTFIGDPNCIHVVTYDVREPADVQLSTVIFWLTFLKARMAILNPIALYGKQPWPAKVALVGTHADELNTSRRNSVGELSQKEGDDLIANIRYKFHRDFDIFDKVFIMDATLPMSPEFKSFRNYLNDSKLRITMNLPYPMDILAAVLQILPHWRKLVAGAPMVTWPSFIDYLRSKVNLLASDEHCKEVICQLQIMGEVVYLETSFGSDLVVLDPDWLGSTFIGSILDPCRSVRPTGCCNPDQLELDQILPEGLASESALPVLQALSLCVRCSMDDEVEFEFPCFNKMETLAGLWSPDPSLVSSGIRLTGPQLNYIFSKVQVSLRRDSLCREEDNDLYQWNLGSKYCVGALECLVTLYPDLDDLKDGKADPQDLLASSPDHHDLYVRCRGPPDKPVHLFTLFHQVLSIVTTTVEDCCPGLDLVHNVLSSKHPARSFSPKDIHEATMSGSMVVGDEELKDLLCLGDQAIFRNLTLGPDLHISQLSAHARRFLCSVLDPPDDLGRDWCLLTVSLGLDEVLPQLDVQVPEHYLPRSKMDRALELWARSESATIGNLVKKLKDLGRYDAADGLMNLAPMYRINMNNNKAENNQLIG